MNGSWRLGSEFGTWLSIFDGLTSPMSLASIIPHGSPVSSHHSLRTNVTFMMTRYSVILPFSTFTF